VLPLKIDSMCASAQVYKCIALVLLTHSAMDRCDGAVMAMRRLPEDGTCDVSKHDGDLLTSAEHN
jgi:hypothetical protein